MSFAVFLAEFGGATIAFLWPSLKGGFGSVVAAGNIDDIRAEIADTGAPAYNGTAASTWSPTPAPRPATSTTRRTS